jgi:hypothetical protein
LAFTPRARATRATEAPGISVSTTIRRFFEMATEEGQVPRNAWASETQFSATLVALLSIIIIKLLRVRPVGRRA